MSVNGHMKNEDEQFITDCVRNILSEINCKTNISQYSYKDGDLIYQGHILTQLTESEEYALNTSISILARNKNPYIFL